MEMSDPFSTLGIQPRFDLDEAELHRHFIQASAANHPDRFTDPLEQADAAARSATINDAYRTLHDPELRANALLDLLGGPDKSADKSLPPALLAEMLEIRERMEEAIASQDETELRELAGWAQTQRAEHLTRIAEMFVQAGTESRESRTVILQKIRLELNALRYFQRMIEQTPEESRDSSRH